MEKLLFLVQVALNDHERDFLDVQAFLMVGENLEEINSRIQEKYPNVDFVWTDIVQYIEVDGCEIKLVSM